MDTLNSNPLNQEHSSFIRDYVTSSQEEEGTENSIEYTPIQALLQELSQMPNKHAFDLASKVSPGMVENDDFLELFLKAENMDPKGAARRLVDYFNYKAQVWGADKLHRHICLADLKLNDVECLSSGGFEIIPTLDTTGQSAIVLNYWKMGFKEKSNLFRSFWFLINSFVSNNVMARKNGVVIVVFQQDRGVLDDDLARKLAHCVSSLPLLVTGIYRCLNNNSNLQRDIFLEILERTYQVGIQVHQGSLNDCASWLVAGDVPISVLASVLRDENTRKIMRFFHSSVRSESSELAQVLLNKNKSRSQPTIGSGTGLLGGIAHHHHQQQRNTSSPATGIVNSLHCDQLIPSIIVGPCSLVGGRMQPFLPAATNINHALGTSAVEQRLLAMRQAAIVNSSRLAAPGTPRITALASSSLENPDRPGGNTQHTLTQTHPTRPARCVYLESDRNIISEYQCLIRQQIEVFTAEEDDIRFHVSKPSKQRLIKGQVGIRCRHCTVLPHLSRPKGAEFYPKDFYSVYQLAQNLTKNHFFGSCRLLPSEVKAKMNKLRNERKRGRGGREQWADRTRELGIGEDKYGLFYL